MIDYGWRKEDERGLSSAPPFPYPCYGGYEDYEEGALFFAATASAGEGSWFATHLRRLFEDEGHVFFTFIQ